MDYEKKYKEALERARDVYTYYCDDREQLRKIESIFPELKESEWKRIKREIIEYIKTGTYHNDWVAWLEKQEQVKDSANFQHENKMCKENGDSLTNEDEKRVKNIISVLDAQVCWDGATMKKMNPYQKEIDWLKSLSLQSK